jgi:hypothetical protein
MRVARNEPLRVLSSEINVMHCTRSQRHGNKGEMAGRTVPKRGLRVTTSLPPSLYPTTLWACVDDKVPTFYGPSRDHMYILPSVDA